MQQPNNSPNQTSSSQHQPPDHRFEELQRQLKEQRDQNQQLRGQVDYLAGQMRQQSGGDPNKKPPESQFKPEVQQAIQAEVDRIISPRIDEFKQRVGFLMDQNDNLAFQLNYGNDKFKPYHEKVESLRQNYQNQGRYITREDALRMVYFEETGKKAAPEPTQNQQAQPPKFDPYFGQYVDPETGLPMKEGAQDSNGNFEQAPQGQQQNQGYQTPQQNQWGQQQQSPQNYQPQQQYGSQQPGMPTPQGSNHPHMNPFGMKPQLPNEMTPASQSPQNQRLNQRVEISLESSDAELQAFENQLGDIEF